MRGQGAEQRSFDPREGSHSYLFLYAEKYRQAYLGTNIPTCQINIATKVRLKEYKHLLSTYYESSTVFYILSPFNPYNTKEEGMVSLISQVKGSEVKLPTKVVTVQVSTEDVKAASGVHSSPVPHTGSCLAQAEI